MDSLINQVIEKLRAKKETISFAESCTGGLLSSSFTDPAGISDVFMGSFVTYSNRTKREILGVPAQILGTMGAVSRPVALHMAKGAKALTQTTWAVSITGIAGPTGGTDTKPVGTVCFAIIGPGIEWTSQEAFSGDRAQVRRSSAEFAIRGLLELL